MAKPLLNDELWEEITALLPPAKPRRFSFPGRKPVDNRKVFTGILFVLKSGIPWEALPREMGCGSGMTCWRRLYEWQRAGVWQSVHELLVAKLPEADKIDWSRARVGRASVSTPVMPPLEVASPPPAEELQPLPLPDIPLDPVPLSERYAA
jgi:transposase